MIVKSQDQRKIIISPQQIKSTEQDQGAGGVIYVDGLVMASYSTGDTLSNELQRFEEYLIEDKKLFQFKKETTLSKVRHNIMVSG